MGSEEEFEEFLFGHVTAKDPELKQEYDDAQLRHMVRVAIRRARRRGFTTAEDISAFVAIMFEVAPNFDLQPEIDAVLTDERFLMRDKIEIMTSPAVPDDAWEKAVEEYDESAWELADEASQSPAS